MIEIYGTIGPACSEPAILEEMFKRGMTGLRLNLSHASLTESADMIAAIQSAAKACGITPRLLIDMQGPELRTGRLSAPLELTEGSLVTLIPDNADMGRAIPVPEAVLSSLKAGQEILLDDGKILLSVCSVDDIVCKIVRGGILKSRKSIAVPGVCIDVPAMTEQDRENIRLAADFGVTGVMQPFVRSAEDLKEVRCALDEAGAKHIKLLAKIENLAGVSNLESFFPLADEIVIARGDLGNAMPLWQLPRVQKEISFRCRQAGKPFMVVTQMLASMENSAVPTRAEVSDIYNAVLDGASSVMVTGETAVGSYPAEVIKYLANTVHEAQNA